MKNKLEKKTGRESVTQSKRVLAEDEALRLEAELERDEIARGLRNADGSVPRGAEYPKSQSEERRAELNSKTAHYGELLANWLNDSRGTPAHRRVCDIIERIRAIRDSISGPYWPTLVTVEGRRFSGGMPREVATGDGKYEKRMLQLRRKFRSYTFSPAFDYPLLGRYWVGSLEPVGKGAQKGQFRLSDHDAVRWLHEIALDGELDRLRQCGCHCGIWFFAHRLDKHFVGDHRQKEYRNSPEFKKHRADYMRNYRSQEKEQLLKGRHHYRPRVTRRNSSQARSSVGGAP